MVSHFLFKDRDGRTSLPEEWTRDLVPNQRHIKLGGELDEAEEENIIEGLIWLEDYTGDYIDWMFWFKLHKKMFENVWTWAGKTRIRELANPDFDHPGNILQNIKVLEGDLKFWLSEGSSMDKKECIVRFHERLLKIHPFSNGNGRTSRILTEYICKRSGLVVPTWGQALRANPKEHRQAYIDAIIKARHKNEFLGLVTFVFG